jgi:hypothetical protein
MQVRLAQAGAPAALPAGTTSDLSLQGLPVGETIFIRQHQLHI